MAKLRFGTGGMPLTTKGERNVKAGIQRIHELGLEHMELEFVYQVFVKEEDAPVIKKLAEEQDVSLSVHGSYYVNLGSEDKQKWHASISRVVQAAARGAAAGAVSVTYHSGFLQGKNADEIHELIKDGTREILEELKKKNVKISVAPELTGKPSQFGELEDLIKLVAELRAEGYGDQVAFCFDFAHKFARSNGGFNSYDEVMVMLEKIAEGLGQEFLDTLHIHMSGIEHSPKGEKNHLVYLPNLAAYAAQGIVVEGIDSHFAELDVKRMGENHFNWQGVLQALKKTGVGGYLVCESPILELDALLMQQYYASI
jgi:deoxyribonuclease IV